MKKPIFILLLVIGMWVFGARSQAQMVIIANADLKIESISRPEVRDIFTGASATMRSGTRVKPILLKRGAAHDEFLAAYIGEKDSEFRSDWMSLLFAGKMFMPPSLDSEADVVEYVAKHSSAIGYVHKATPHKGVVVLAVQ